MDNNNPDETPSGLMTYIEVPAGDLQEETLQALLEEFASRDGTDYGATERALSEKVAELRAQIVNSEVCLVCEIESETWDLLPRDEAAQLLSS